MQKWSDILPKSSLNLARGLQARTAKEREAGKVIYPAQENIFRALTLTPPGTVKICLVGQDPYHGAGEANGLAFSVNDGVRIPPSLRNIFNELYTDLNVPYPTSGDLTPWAKQGVLLLNTVLTVEHGQANSHKDWGWQEFTQSVFEACAKLPQPIVFVTWGGQARAFVAGINITRQPNKAAIWSSHPSPLGATKGNEVVPAFIGSRPFSKVNKLLIGMGSEPIDWRLEQ